MQFADLPVAVQELLANSRNRFRSIVTQPVTPQPVTPQPVTPQPVTPQPVTPGLIAHVRPSIEIADRIIFASGQTIKEPYRYTTGIPPSFAFGIKYYDLDSNRIEDINILTENIPEHAFMPELPGTNTNVIYNAELQLKAPIVEETKLIYAKLLIYQLVDDIIYEITPQ